MIRLALHEGSLVVFEANGHKYNYGYFLADDIYPRWQTFVKPIIQPRDKKQTQFHNVQATARKDVERAFGILQAQFAIVRWAARFWDQECLWYIMNACVIVHNMIIEDDREKKIDHIHYELMGVPMQVRRSAHRVTRFIVLYHFIRFNDTHDEL
jgi:hypothetical protein